MSEEATDYCLVRQYHNKKRRIVRMGEIFVCGKNKNYDTVATVDDIISASNGVNKTLRIKIGDKNVAIFVETFGETETKLQALLKEAAKSKKRIIIRKRLNFTPDTRPVKQVNRRIVLKRDKENTIKDKKLLKKSKSKVLREADSQIEDYLKSKDSLDHVENSTSERDTENIPQLSGAKTPLKANYENQENVKIDLPVTKLAFPNNEIEHVTIHGHNNFSGGKDTSENAVYLRKKNSSSLHENSKDSPNSLSNTEKEVSIADTEILNLSGCTAYRDEEIPEQEIFEASEGIESPRDLKNNKMSPTQVIEEKVQLEKLRTIRSKKTNSISKSSESEEVEEETELTEPVYMQEENNDAFYSAKDKTTSNSKQIRHTAFPKTIDKKQKEQPKPIITSEEAFNVPVYDLLRRNKILNDRITNLQYEKKVLENTVHRQKKIISSLEIALNQERNKPTIIQMSSEDFKNVIKNELTAVENRIVEKIDDSLSANPGRPNENKENNASVVTFGRFGLPEPDEQNMIQVTQGKKIHEKCIASAIKESDYRKRVNHLVVGWWTEDELMRLGFVRKDGEDIDLIDSDTVEKIRELCCQLDGKKSKKKPEPSKEDVQSWISRKLTYFKAPRRSKKLTRKRRRSALIKKNHIIDDSEDDGIVVSSSSEEENPDSGKENPPKNKKPKTRKRQDFG